LKGERGFLPEDCGTAEKSELFDPKSMRFKRKKEVV